jgi:hypothetical protein
VDNHETHYRLSLLTGDSHYDTEEFSRSRLSEAINDLLTGSDPEAMHRVWLTSNVANGFGELRVKPVTPDETNVKNQIETPKSEH